MSRYRTIVAVIGITLAVWFIGAAFSAQRPDTTGSVVHVLASARAAYGPADLNHLGELVETGAKRASGLNGRWRLAEDVPTGRKHETSDFGVIRSAEVWDGRNHWRQDHSGGVHALNSAFALANAATDMWLARRGFLRSDAEGARLEYVKPQRIENRAYETIRATPPGGQPVELWFDSTTGLLARSIWLMPIDTVTIRYEDYRWVGTIMVPFKVISQEGDSDPDTTAVDHAEFMAHPANDEFAVPSAPDDLTVAGGVTTVPISYDGDVVVEAMLNGKGPLGFILDTGGHNILTPEAAQALGLNAVGAGSAGGSGGGALPVQYTRVVRVDIGGVSLRDQSFLVIPLQYNTVERGSKAPLAGILGVELFERLAIELNYRAQSMTLRPMKDAPRGHGVPVAITFTDDQPIFSAKIDGIAGDNGLDTGNSGALVVQGRWARGNGLAPRMRRGLPTAGFGSGGMSQNWAVRADVEVAGILFPHIVASYSEDKKGAFSSRTEAGNIGNEIYSNFTLAFDYAHNTVWFDSAPEPHQTIPYSRAGMSIYKQSADSFTVASVLPNAPAAEAGIAAGDEIIAVDGTAARELSGWDMKRIVRKEVGTKLVLKIRRAGQQRSASVTLRELLS